MQSKIQKRFVDEGFGFPVVLRNATMVKVRGTWTPKVDYNKMAKLIVMALAHKPSRLTGAEIKFVRQYFKMTLTQFGNRFSVSHPGVIKWESSGEEPTLMRWSTEKDIRLFIAASLKEKPARFAMLYRELEHEASPKVKPIEMDLKAA